MKKWIKSLSIFLATIMIFGYYSIVFSVYSGAITKEDKTIILNSEPEIKSETDYVTGTYEPGFETSEFIAFTESYTKNKAFYLPECPYTRDGYTFNGWEIDGDLIGAGVKVKSDSSFTATATWEKTGIILGDDTSSSTSSTTSSATSSISKPEVPSDKCGDNLYWELDEEGTLTITGSGDMYDYASYASYQNSVAPWTDNRSDIKKIILEDGITSIGNFAFYRCTNLNCELKLPNSIVSIGKCAYENCSFTGSLTIPSSVTSIGDGAFRDCSGFTGSLTIPNSVKSIGECAFYGCSGFTGSLTIPNSVTSIGSSAFYGCSGFTGDLIIPNSVKSIGTNAFSECRGFNGILKLSDNLTEIEARTFLECNGFVGDLVIPDNVTYIGPGAFAGCGGFTGNLTLPENLKYIGYNYLKKSSNYQNSISDGNESLPRLNGAPGINDGAFAECNGFSGMLIIPNSVQGIYDYTFYGCSGFTGELILSENLSSLGQSAFQDCTGFTGNLTIPNGVTTIGENTFYGCSGFTGDLIIPNSLDRINSNVFWGCEGFDGKLIIPDSVVSIYANAFTGCNNLEGAYFDGKAPSVRSATVSGASFPKNLTLHYYIGKDGWTSPEWKGYKTVAMQSQDTFVIKFDANGGNGTPVEQLKNRDVTLTLSAMIPEREGYTFLGWSSEKDAKYAQYQAGGSYIANMSTTLYAVWEKIIYPDLTLTIENVESRQGDYFDLILSIDKNPDIAAISFGFNYNKDKFSLVGYYDLGLTGWVVGVTEGEKAIWLNEEGSSATGDIIKFRFKIADGTAVGDETITLSNVVIADADENKLKVNVVAGNVSIKEFIIGDVNSDNSVDALDLLRLAKYVANMDVTIDDRSSNVNGDDEISVGDVLRLSKFLAGYNVSLEA